MLSAVFGKGAVWAETSSWKLRRYDIVKNSKYGGEITYSG